MRILMMNRGPSGVLPIQLMRAVSKVRDISFDMTIVRSGGPPPPPPTEQISDWAVCPDAFLSQFGGKWVAERPISVDRERKTVTFEGKDSMAFDVLIENTESEAFPIEEIRHGTNTILLRSVYDIASLRRAVAVSRKVCIFGSGYVGIEAAKALAALRTEVTVVDNCPTILRRGTRTDPETFLDMCEAEIRKDERIRIMVSQRILRLQMSGERKITQIELDSGAIVETDLVVDATAVIEDRPVSGRCAEVRSAAEDMPSVDWEQVLQVLLPEGHAIPESWKLQGSVSLRPYGSCCHAVI